ncbi:MAG: hypothetical protein ACREBR_02580 [bacterium]
MLCWIGLDAPAHLRATPTKHSAGGNRHQEGGTPSLAHSFFVVRTRPTYSLDKSDETIDFETKRPISSF